MTYFFQGAATVLVAAVLCLVLDRQGKDFSVLITICVCCLLVYLGLSFLDPVLDFMEKLESLGNLDSSMISILFKIVGIGIISEVAGMICSDAGNASMGKALQILASAVILWLSIPIFNAMLELIQEILGEV